MLGFKQTDEEVLIEKALRTTILILYDKGLFDNKYGNADKVLRNYLIIGVIERRRLSLEPLNDVIQNFYSKLQF